MTPLLSSDLQTWTPAGGELILESLTRPAGEGYENVTMRLDNPGAAYTERAFFVVEAASVVP